MKKNEIIIPSGKIKIMRSFSRLMEEKDFYSVTTAKIAGTAGVTEGLIYKYFKSKKELLYQVLNEQLIEFDLLIEQRIAYQGNAIEKITIIIFTSLESLTANRVFSRLLFLEVRKFPDFFNTEAYHRLRINSQKILGIIEEGIEKGELKSIIDPVSFRNVIFGAIEHACLAEIIFGKKLNVENVSNKIGAILFDGVKA